MRPLWRLLDEATPDRSWFWARLLRASVVVVVRWGPTWAQRQIVGRPVGAWFLVGVWLAIPVVVALVAFR